MWERKVDILLEFLEWLESEAAVGNPQGGGGDAFDRAPRTPDSIYVRVAAFAPDGFMDELATACLAIGRRREALAEFDEGKASRADVGAAALEADRNLEYMRALVRNEVKMAPYRSEKVTPALLRALRERRRATDG